MHSNDNQRGLGKRLQIEMRKRDLTAKALAELADVKSSFLYDVISGKSANPSSIKLARVAESLGVSLTYLAGTSDSPTEGYHFSLPSQIQDVAIIPQLTVENHTLVGKENAHEYCQFRKDWIQKELGAKPQDLRLFQVHDDSMAPTLQPGDLLMIDLSKTHATPPGIFVLFDGHGVSAKRLELLPSSAEPKLRVICDNSHYSTYETTMQDTRIVGRMVWFSRKV